jgi:TonB family protein
MSPHELPRGPRLLLTLVLPPERREEFIGDLLEEAEQRRNRGGLPSGWFWGQVLRSWPSLAVARLRRAPAGRVAVAVAGAPAGLAGIFGDSRFAPRSLAVVISVLLHIAIFAVMVVRSTWTVEELSGPSVPVVFWERWLPQSAPSFGEAKKAPPVRERPTVRPRPNPKQVPTPAVVPVVITPGPSTGEDSNRIGGPRGEGTGDDGIGECTGDQCGPAPTPPAAVLPPRVGEKSCVSCPVPHLPPAYLRIGASYSVMVRICVDVSGRVESVKVLQGLGASADESVVATVSGWRFSPYKIDGRPVPFCYATRFLFSAQ